MKKGGARNEVINLFNGRRRGKAFHENFEVLSGPPSPPKKIKAKKEEKWHTAALLVYCIYRLL